MQSSSSNDSSDYTKLVDLDHVWNIFHNKYVFGANDPALSRDKIELVIAHTIRLGDRCWYVVRVRSKNPPIIQHKPVSLRETRYALEGPAGLGKSTLLGRWAGGDLAELRKGPYHLLCGMTEEFANHRRYLRASAAGSAPIVDRDDWLSSTVYCAYYTGAMFLYDDPHLVLFPRLSSDYDTIVVDDPNLTDEALHQRIVERGSFDSHMPLSYTTITRIFFKLAAKHYNLMTMTMERARLFIDTLRDEEVE